jgi:hypothetical protein
MTHSLALRQLAVITFYLAQGHVAPAMILFVFFAGKNHGVVDLPGFIRRWVDAFVKTGSVQHRYRGRQRTVPPDVAQQCVMVLLAGYKEEVLEEVNGKRRVVEKQKYYTSIRDAVARSMFLQEVIDQYEINLLLGTTHSRHCPHTLRHACRRAASIPSLTSECFSHSSLKGKSPAGVAYLARGHGRCCAGAAFLAQQLPLCSPSRNAPETPPPWNCS